MDSHGRVFYIDHATRTTSWSRPGGNIAENAASGAAGAEQHRRQLDRRYQSIRRTISSMRLEEGATIDISRIPPGCQLLTRPDFFTVLHMNQVIYLKDYYKTVLMMSVFSLGSSSPI